VPHHGATGSGRSPRSAAFSDCPVVKRVHAGTAGPDRTADPVGPGGKSLHRTMLAPTKAPRCVPRQRENGAHPLVSMWAPTAAN